MEPLPLDIAAHGGPAEALENAERRSAIQSALLELSVEAREVILLRHFTDLWSEDIAATLDLPVKTVKSRLYTARQTLAAILQERRVS